MDLHCTASHASNCDAELPAVIAGSVEFSPGVAVEPPSARAAQFVHPDAAARVREEGALEALEAQITRLWGHINAATAQFLALLAEFDRKEGWAQHGMASCAHWLSWQCGIGPVAAREKVRTARALESLPKIAEAFGEGRLSYSKVRALTRVATAATEETLLHIALNGTAEHVERTVRGFRRVQRENERNEAEAVHERRYLDCRRESDGSVTLEARLAPEVGEMLLKALEAAEAQLDGPGADAKGTGAQSNGKPGGIERAEAAESAHSACGSVSAETPPRSASQRRSDALEHIVERFLAGAGSRSAAGAHELVVHIAHDALRDVPESSGAALDNGHRVAVETARAPPATAGVASAWTTTSPSTHCAGRRAIPDEPPACPLLTNSLQANRKPSPRSLGIAAQRGDGRRHPAALQPRYGRLRRAEAPGNLRLRELRRGPGPNQLFNQRILLFSPRVFLPELRILHETAFQIAQFRHRITSFILFRALRSARAGILRVFFATTCKTITRRPVAVT